MKRSFWIVSGIVCALGVWTAVISADTLVMRNGNRMSGRLIGLRPGDIQKSLPLGIASYMTRAALRDIRLRRL